MGKKQKPMMTGRLEPFAFDKKTGGLSFSFGFGWRKIDDRRKKEYSLILSVMGLVDWPDSSDRLPVLGTSQELGKLQRAAFSDVQGLARVDGCGLEGGWGKGDVSVSFCIPADRPSAILDPEEGWALVGFSAEEAAERLISFVVERHELWKKQVVKEKLAQEAAHLLDWCIEQINDASRKAVLYEARKEALKRDLDKKRIALTDELRPGLLELLEAEGDRFDPQSVKVALGYLTAGMMDEIERGDGFLRREKKVKPQPSDFEV
jgi:hypothetical protein